MSVRDEEDILAANLRFHHALGVERFIITDHESRDSTVDLLRRWEEAGIAVVRRRSGSYAEGRIEWMNEMAREAATDLDADWVIHGDADEFWLPAAGNLASTLARIPPEYGAVVAPRTEFLGAADTDEPFYERLLIREARSASRPKVAHRADPRVEVLDRGAHNVASLDDQPRPKHGSERAVLRGAHGRDEGVSDVRFVWAPKWPLRILHFPVRSLGQIRRRTEVLLYEGGFRDKGRQARLRERFEREGPEPIYADLLMGDDEVRAGLSSGELIRDERLRNVLGQCPDPLSAEAPEAGSVELRPDSHELESELSALERDAMRSITRAHYRVTLAQNRLLKRVDKLERRLAERTAGDP